MPPHEESMKPSCPDRFDRAAGDYDQGAIPQQDVARLLISKIPDLSPRRVFEIGCGTGFLTGLARERYPKAEIHASDAAHRMIEVARKRNLPGVTWRVSAWPNQQPDPPVDLVLSASALHWVNPVEEGLAAIDRALTDGGWAAVSLMTRGTLSELQTARGVVLRRADKSRQLPTEQQILDSLPSTLEIRHHQVFEKSYFYPSMQDVWRALIAQGVNGDRYAVAVPRLTPKEVRAVADEYVRIFHHPVRGLPVTYRSLLVIARKSS